MTVGKRNQLILSCYDTFAFSAFQIITDNRIGEGIVIDGYIEFYTSLRRRNNITAVFLGYLTHLSRDVLKVHLKIGIQLFGIIYGYPSYTIQTAEIEIISIQDIPGICIEDGCKSPAGIQQGKG